MSEVKDGIIGMPFELAMGTAISRRQFHGCAVAEIARLKAELECALGDLATAKGIIDRLQKDADRYALIKSKACTEDRDGGYTGFWRLPCMPGWDGTPYSKSRKEDFNYRDSLDKAVDSVIAKELS